MSDQSSGGCLCGAVRFDFAGPPVVQALCHCTHCQKQAGSAFSIIVGVPEGALTIHGEPKSYADSGESGKAVIRQFCGTCGSPLFSRVEVSPGLVWVKAGTLDDTSALKPTMQLWARSRQPWLEIAEVPVFETNPA